MPRHPDPSVKLAVALVETMMGRRPLHSVRRIITAAAFSRLSAYRLSGAFTQSRFDGLRCKRPTPTAAEISLRISTAERWRVCVLRMDFDTRWICTELVVLGA